CAIGSNITNQKICGKEKQKTNKRDTQEMIKKYNISEESILQKTKKLQEKERKSRIITQLESTPGVLTNNSALSKDMAPHSTNLNRGQNRRRI
ncbi:40374_t:CDS:2, partial [Gigaspora margarita]